MYDIFLKKKSRQARNFPSRRPFHRPPQFRHSAIPPFRHLHLRRRRSISCHVWCQRVIPISHVKHNPTVMSVYSVSIVKLRTTDQIPRNAPIIRFLGITRHRLRANRIPSRGENTCDQVKGSHHASSHVNLTTVNSFIGLWLCFVLHVVKITS